MTNNHAGMFPKSTSGTSRLLVVDAPHFYAGAVWQRVNDAWQCIEAAPILKWMRGKSAAEVGEYLQRKGWSYQWVAG